MHLLASAKCHPSISCRNQPQTPFGLPKSLRQLKEKRPNSPGTAYLESAPKEDIFSVNLTSETLSTTSDQHLPGPPTVSLDPSKNLASDLRRNRPVQSIDALNASQHNPILSSRTASGSMLRSHGQQIIKRLEARSSECNL